MLRRLVCGFAIACALLAMRAQVAAGPHEAVELADGARVSAQAGRLVLEAGGKRTRSKLVKDADPKAPASLLVAHRLAGDLEAVHVRFPTRGGGAVDAVAVRGAGRARLEIVWQGSTGLAGEIGERLGWEVRFDDLTGDGAPEIIVGRVYEAVRLCGAERLPLLFRRVYDPGTGKLRPVLAKRPDVPGAKDVVATGPEGSTSSILGAATPVSASRSAGDRGEPLLLAPPGALVDGDPATAWIPGNGAGGGEFATFSVLAREYGVTRLGLRAVPAGDKPGRYDRPRTLLLVAEDRVFRLAFERDPRFEAEELVWFELPEPVRTSCLSLVVEETYDPKSGKPLALTDLVVLTEVDTPDGLERLAADLDADERGEQAAMLLRRVGELAADPIREAWSSLGQNGRRRAVRVLAEAAPKKTADLLAVAAVGDDPVAAEAATSGIERAGEAGTRALAAFLEAKDDTEFERTVRILGRLDSDSAFDALIAATGSGGRARRRLMREQIGGMAGRAPERRERLWSAIERADSAGESERMLDLMRAAAGLPEIADRLVELAAARFAGATEFADRYRLLEVLAGSGSAVAQAHLLAGFEDEDRKIRAVAVVGAGLQPDWDRARDLVRDALADDAVEVRLAALGAMAVGGLVETAATELERLGSEDPWPVVRARVVTMAGRLPEERAVALLGAAAVDESLSVQLAAMEVAGRVDAKGVGAVIEERLADGEEQPEVRAAAARAAGRRCQVSAAPALYELLRKGAEPLARAEDIEAAVEAARAMGRIGGEQTGELLEQARRRSNPATDKAIDAALESLGQRCGNAPHKEEGESGASKSGTSGE